MNHKKNNCLVVIGRLHYPSGSAPSNRTHLYCKALKEAGGVPLVINLYSPFTQPQNFPYFGRNNGINYIYCQGTIFRENNFIKRNLKKIKGVFTTLAITVRMTKNNNVKVLFFSTNYFQEIIFSSIFKFSNIKIIRELNEAPIHILQEKKQTHFQKLKERMRLKMYDQVIVISDKLFGYYINFYKKKQIIQIPILVDMERFSEKIFINSTEKRILSYVGYMGGTKDGLPDLIKSMALVIKKYDNILLQLIGTAELEELQKLKKLVADLNMEKYVKFTGKLESNEISTLIKNSYLLLLARPDNKQAEYGFATKLGEYLASGRPVVITNTGEITKFLSDGISAYIAEPGNINNFSEKVIEALENSNRSEKIGLEGQKVAANFFNYKLYGDKIIKILQA